MIKRIATIPLILGLAIPHTAYADYLKSAQFTSDLKICVEASAPDYAGKSAAILIYPNGSDLTALGSAETQAALFETMDYYRQINIADDGSFGCEVLFDDKEKGYRDIKITIDGNSEVYEKAVYVVTQNDIDSFVSTVNLQNVADSSFCSYIIGNLPIIAEEGSEYASNENIRLSVASELLNVRDSLYDGKFKSTEDIKKAFNMALLVSEVNLADSKSKIEALTEKYKTASALDKFCFMKYYEECKNEVCSALAGVSDADVTDFCNILGETVTLTMIKNVSNHNEIPDIIKNLNDFLKLDLTAYESLADKSSVNKGVMNSTESLSDFKYAFESLVDDAYYNSNSRPSSGGGSGGGFGGGSGSVVGNVEVGQSSETSAAPREYFSDIADYGWAKESIDSLAALGIVSGVGGGKYEPSRHVTREEFVKMIVEAFSAVDADASCDFADVASDDWCYKYIASAVKSGFVNGIDADRFGKGGEIKRQDAAVILSRICNEKAASQARFNDIADISDYASDAVNLMAQLGVVNGNENGDFKPHNPLTRAECAKIIYTLYKQIRGVN